MSENKPDTSEETFQEGTTPVQAFSTPVILATENRLRQGRPPRVPAAANACEAAGAAGTAQSRAQPTDEPAKSAAAVAAALDRALTPDRAGG